jgi:hypothetical protein
MASATARGGEPLEGFCRPDAVAACCDGERDGDARSGFGSDERFRRSGIVGVERSSMDLEGEQSPWKERVSRRWQRRCGTTDSSAEQGLEASCVARFDRVQCRHRFGGVGTGPRVIRDLGCGALFGRLRASNDPLTGWPHGGEPLPPVGSIACLVAALRRCRRGKRFRASSSLGFGRGARHVLDDVGVRFGGSEHHRIRIPSRASAYQSALAGGRALPSGSEWLNALGRVAHPPRRASTRLLASGFGRERTAHRPASAGWRAGRWSATA